MKKSILLAAAASLALGTASSNAAVILRITEVMSSGDTRDWFELTNFGDEAANISGYRMDDESVAFGSSVALVGITSIAPGESVIFTEGQSGNATSNVALLRSNWNLATSVQVGGYVGSGVGLGSDPGDKLTLFTGGGTELAGPFSNLIRVAFGVATEGASFQWNYDLNNLATSAPSPVISTGPASWVNVSVNMIATPGYVPEPSAALLGCIGALGLLRRRRA